MLRQTLMLLFAIGLFLIFFAAGADELSTPDFNVMDFGAIGDGETDDTAAINRVLASAANELATVVLPKDHKFILTDQLNVPEGVSVRAYGATLEWISVNSTPIPSPAFPGSLSETGNGIRLQSNSTWLGGDLIFNNVDQPKGDLSLTGEFWNMIAIGHFTNYTTSAMDEYTENVTVRDINAQLINGNYHHAIVICGLTRNVDISNVNVSYLSEQDNISNGIRHDKSAIEATWGGADGITYHPHDIILKNIVIEGYVDPKYTAHIRGIHLSGIYNVTVSDIAITDCVLPFNVYIGDPGDPGGLGPQGDVPSGGKVNEEQVGLIGTNIQVDRLHAENFNVGFAIRGDGHGSSHYERMSHPMQVTLTNSVLIGQGPLSGRGEWTSNVGVYISDTDGCEILNNKIMNCSEGINLRTPQKEKEYLAPRELAIIGNQISQIQRSGVTLPTAINALIQDNKISHCGIGGVASDQYAAIWLAGQDNLVEQNELGAYDDTTTQYGVYVGLGDQSKCQPGNNLLKHNIVRSATIKKYGGMSKQFVVE